MKNNVITIYVFVDDFLKHIDHKEPANRRVSDAQVITAALVAARHFYGHHERSLSYLKQDELFPEMLDKSRFSRRLYQIKDLFVQLFFDLAKNYQKAQNRQ